MKERFEGSTGRSLLIEALSSQHLIRHEHPLASYFAEHGNLKEFAAGDSLFQQNAFDNHILLILSGEASVHVNGRHVATRGPSDSVGEMACIDPAAPRSATVKANTQLLALQINASDFIEASNRFPKLWKNVAVVTAQRLRQRGSFHRPPNAESILFIGSSSEGLEVARQIQLGLAHDKITVRVWTDGVFGPSRTPLSSLMSQVQQCDFAALVFGPDDTIASRSVVQEGPRDNVVFELGLFLSALNIDRSFIIKDKSTDIKIPSDLMGITPIEYTKHGQTLESSDIAPICTQLRTSIAERGPR